MKELRGYQELAIKAIEDDLAAGFNRLLLVMSMGLGKTFTAVKLVERLDFKRVLWVTDDERLLDQSAIAFIQEKYPPIVEYVQQYGIINAIREKKTFAGYKIGIIKSDLFIPDGDIVFASAQTLWRRLEKLDHNHYDCVIIDECHVFGAKTFFQGIDHFKPKLRLGLSGSPFRKDGMMMSDIFQKISFEYNMAEGIKDKWLCELDAIRIKTNCSLDNVHTLAGDFNEKELSDELNTLSRNNLIADSYIKYAKGRKAIGFGIDIQHCIDLADAFQNKGINAVAISSDEERTGDKNIKIRNYRSGNVDVIFNVNLLAKGFDDPDTGCSIAAAPTKSLVRYLQGPAGRPSRLKSDEYVARFGQNAIILDIVDITTRHNLVNAWELDKQKPVEERVFVSQDKKDKLLEARKNTAKITHKRDKDEIVNLLQIPKLKISKFYSMSDDATQAQLDAISKFGYDIAETHYTKWMITEIFAAQPCTLKQIGWLKWKGYDLSSGIPTRGEFEAAKKEVEKRTEKADREARDKIVKNNMKPYMGNQR